MLERVVEQARACGATRLYLETNHTLSEALHLYRAMGFRELAPERMARSEYLWADVFMKLLLEAT